MPGKLSPEAIRFSVAPMPREEVKLLGQALDARPRPAPKAV